MNTDNQSMTDTSVVFFHMSNAIPMNEIPFEDVDVAGLGCKLQRELYLYDLNKI